MNNNFKVFVMCILGICILAITLLTCDKGNPNYNPYAPIGPGAKHQCVDNTHAECDGYCTCDGMGCKYATNARIMNQYVPIRDYQIEIVEDSLLIYDGKRFVGAVAFEYTPIDSLICADND